MSLIRKYSRQQGWSVNLTGTRFRAAFCICRQELVEHYETLMKEAKLREQRAEWRTRRLELNDARKQLWQAEGEEVRQEMEKLSFESDKLSPSSPQPSSPHLSPGDQKRDHVIPSDIPMASHKLTIEQTSSDVEESFGQENIASEEPHPLSQEPRPLIQEPRPQLEKSLDTTIHDALVTRENTETANISKIHVSELSTQQETGAISKPHVSDSVVQQVLNPTHNGNTVMEEFSKYLSPRQQPRRGMAPPTTIQNILYPSNSPGPAYHTTRGKPPPTTIQNLLYHYDQSGMR